MRTWNYIKLFTNFLGGTVRPNQTRYALRVGESLCNLGFIEKSVQKLKENESGKTFFDLKDKCSEIKLEEFATMAEGSLGKSYYHFMTKNNLDPEALPAVKYTNDSEYLEYRVRKTHDVLHVVTGFDTSVLGELGLQAVMAKQFHWPFSMISLAAGFLHTLWSEPERIPRLMDNIALGIKIGSQSSNLIVIDWNQYWSWPLEDLKRELGVFTNELTVKVLYKDELMKEEYL